MPTDQPTLPSQTIEPLLRVRGLRVAFRDPNSLWRNLYRIPHAVENVSLEISSRETLGIVGESGSGKSTIARAVMGLIAASSARVEGEIEFAGKGVWKNGAAATAAAVRAFRRETGIVFQDPGGSLDPKMRVGDSIAEPLLVHAERESPSSGKGSVREKVRGLLASVELPGSAADRFPHEFSGGQRQRISIARAIALSPRLVVLDEPTSALDVSTQARIINLLKDLQRQRGLSYLFISHDLALVEHFCDRVVVMKSGKIVESGTRDEVLGNARESYTRELISAAAQDQIDSRRL